MINIVILSLNPSQSFFRATNALSQALDEMSVRRSKVAQIYDFAELVDNVFFYIRDANSNQKDVMSSNYLDIIEDDFQACYSKILLNGDILDLDACSSITNDVYNHLCIASSYHIKEMFRIFDLVSSNGDIKQLRNLRYKDSDLILEYKVHDTTCLLDEFFS